MTTAHHPLVEQAAALMALDRTDEARALLARRLADDPSDVRAWTRLARCHLSAEEYEEALAATGEALALAPEDYDAHCVRVYALRRLVRPDEALAEAQETIRINPQLWQGYAALSEALTAFQPRWPEALEAAATAVRLGLDEVDAHSALWKAAVVNGRFDLRHRAVLEILRIDPQDAWALGERARMAEWETARPPLTGAGAKLPAAAEAFADALAAAPRPRRPSGSASSWTWRCSGCCAEPAGWRCSAW
ncbi:tetratricopeptide repeat protein [Kitasatospora acidiphila]|uniref:tetratricopeptide repeat protein n=1 Tax=Kitasatospora acidiphila TaxID=2567942 RepID=UPI001E475976|nr:tetratricopeptide repeat protein [Kitasatospora acidiphila]